MLERAPAYLEQGAPRLICSIRKPAHSSRKLRSSFWHHGAGNISLPLLPSHTTGLAWTSPAEQETISLPSSLLDSSLLEFLLPAKTMIRRIACSNGVRDRRPSRKPFFKPAVRLYASEAAVLRSDADCSPTHGECVPIQDTRPAPLGSGGSRKTAWRKNTLQMSIEDWRNQLEKSPIDQACISHSRFLAASRQTLDSMSLALDKLHSEGEKLLVEVSTKLLTMMKKKRQSKWTPSGYAMAVKASLFVKDITTATMFYEKAESVGKEQIIEKEALVITLRTGAWEFGYFVYSKLLQQEKSRFWDCITRLHPLELLDLLPDHPFPASDLISRAVRDSFIPDLLDKSFSHILEVCSSVEYSPFLLENLGRLLEKLPWPTVGHYSLAIDCLLDPLHAKGDHYRADSPDAFGEKDKRTRLAFHLWRVLPEDVRTKIETPLVEKLCAALCDSHCSQALYVFESLRHRPSSQYLAEKILANLAYLGSKNDFQKSLNMFKPQFRGMGPQIDIARILLHGRRGEFRKAQEIMRQSPSDLLSWNALIKASSETGDQDGTLNLVKEMELDGQKPNTETLQSLVNLAAYRGDTGTVRDTIQKVFRQPGPFPGWLLHNFIVAHLQDGDLSSAESMLLTASQMGKRGIDTEVWNSVIDHISDRKPFEQLYEFHQVMVARKVPKNAGSYAAFMRSFSNNHRPDLAYSLLVVTMPAQGTSPSIQHFNTLLDGCLMTYDISLAQNALQHMRMLDIELDANIKIKLLKLGILIDEYENWATRPRSASRSPKLPRAEKLLEHFLQTSGPKDVAHYPPGHDCFQVKDTYPAILFEDVMAFHSQNGDRKKVISLYEVCQYWASERKRLTRPAVLPGGLLDIVMKAYLDAGEHEKVRQCWQLIFLQARSSGDLVRLDRSPAQRDRSPALDRPLLFYLNSLAKTRSIGAMARQMRELERLGIRASGSIWSFFIRTLEENQFSLRAVLTAERHLLKHWKGWPAMSLLDRQMTGQLLGGDQLGFREGRNTWVSIKTLEALARAYERLKKKQPSKWRLEELDRLLARKAPRVLDALTKMPKQLMANDVTRPD